jgi:hypothetical protein
VANAAAPQDLPPAVAPVSRPSKMSRHFQITGDATAECKILALLPEICQGGSKKAATNLKFFSPSHR